MTLSPNINTREFEKFEEGPSGETRVKTTTIVESSSPVPIEFADPDTPTIYNVPTPGTANTEFSQALSADTKRLEVKVRGTAQLKISFVLGESGVNFITIPANCSWNSGEVSLTGKTLYMQCNKASQVVEILEWS